MPTATLTENETSAVRFRAVAGKYQSVGSTPEEALNALLAQEGGVIDSSAILIQRFVPDAYFTQAQFDRMQELLARQKDLTEQENSELDDLIDAELEATIQRTRPLPQPHAA